MGILVGWPCGLNEARRCKKGLSAIPEGVTVIVLRIFIPLPSQKGITHFQLIDSLARIVLGSYIEEMSLEQDFSL